MQEIENPSITILSMAFVVPTLVGSWLLAFHQAKRELFPQVWFWAFGLGLCSLALVGGISSDQDNAFLAAQYFAVLFFAWLGFTFALVWNQKRRDAKIFAIILPIAMVIGRISNMLWGP